MAKKKIQTVIIVTAYGEDNYYQKQYEDRVGIFASVSQAIKAAKKDGMTNSQEDYMRRANSINCLCWDVRDNKESAYQVDYWDEEDPRRKPITSSYMFETVNLDCA